MYSYGFATIFFLHFIHNLNVNITNLYVLFRACNVMTDQGDFPGFQQRDKQSVGWNI